MLLLLLLLLVGVRSSSSLSSAPAPHVPKREIDALVDLGRVLGQSKWVPEARLLACTDWFGVECENDALDVPHISSVNVFFGPPGAPVVALPRSMVNLTHLVEFTFAGPYVPDRGRIPSGMELDLSVFGDPEMHLRRLSISNVGVRNYEVMPQGLRSLLLWQCFNNGSRHFDPSAIVFRNERDLLRVSFVGDTFDKIQESAPLPAAFLQNAVSLESLVLAGFYFSGDIPLAWSRFSGLTELNLTTCSLNDMTPLAPLTQLRTLDLGVLDKGAVLPEMSLNVDVLRFAVVDIEAVAAVRHLLVRAKAIDQLSVSSLKNLNYPVEFLSNNISSVPQYQQNMSAFFCEYCCMSTSTLGPPAGLTFPLQSLKLEAFGCDGDLSVLNVDNLFSSLPKLQSLWIVPSVSTISATVSNSGALPDQLTELKLSLLFGNRPHTSAIPPLFWSGPFLKRLTLSRNNFTGNVPGQFASLQNLEHLDLSGNNLVGQVPHLGKSIRSLVLKQNFITGNVRFIQNMKSLEHVNLERNNLTDWSSLTLNLVSSRITVLRLSHNPNLKVVLNSRFFSLFASLQTLVLKETPAVGHIPLNLPASLYESLEILTLGSRSRQEEATGDLSTFVLFKNLRNVDVQNFNWDGSFLPKFSQADAAPRRSLQRLSLSNCSIRGPFTSSWNSKSLPNLRILELDHNDLNGSLPSDLAEFFSSPNRHVYISVRANHLTDPLPDISNLVHARRREAFQVSPVLDLSKNDFHHIHESFRFAYFRNNTKFPMFNLSGNPLECPTFDWCKDTVCPCVDPSTSGTTTTTSSHKNVPMSKGFIVVWVSCALLVVVMLGLLARRAKQRHRARRMCRIVGDRPLMRYGSRNGGRVVDPVISASAGEDATLLLPASDEEHQQQQPENQLINLHSLFDTLARDWIIDWDELALQECIGTGVSGTVHVAMYHGRRVCVKLLAILTRHLLIQGRKENPNSANVRRLLASADVSLPSSGDGGGGGASPVYEEVSQDEALKTFVNEFRYLCVMDHPNIVSLIGVCVQPLSLVLQYVEFGNLQDLIRHNADSITPSIALTLARDIAEGLRYLHTRPRPVMHRDLKSSNILITAKWRAKLSDFGVSRMIPSEHYKTLTASVGTVLWMSPEMLAGDGAYSISSDVYSYGIVLWELVAKRTPFTEFPTVHEFRTALEGGFRPEIPPSCPSVLKTIIEKCWVGDPSARPSMTALCDMFSAF